MKTALGSRRFRVVAGVVMCMALFVPIAHAGVVLDLPVAYLTGAHSITLDDVPSEVVATGSWATGFSITSTFEYDSGLGLFKYTYNIETNSDKNISHFIIEVSSDIEEDELIGLPSGPGDLETIDPTLYKPTDPGNSNPSLPADIFGFKVDHVKQTSYSFSFYSPRLPMFGSFYSKDGTDDHGTIDVYAYNAGLASSPDELAQYGAMTWDQLAALNLFLYVPDTATLPSVVTPLPAGAALGGLGMGCLALRKVRRRKR